MKKAQDRRKVDTLAGKGSLADKLRKRRNRMSDIMSGMTRRKNNQSTDSNQ